MIPTLIIGLGGYGSQVVAEISQSFLAGNPSAEDIARFAYYCIDTDGYAIEKLRSRIPKDRIVDLSPYSQRPLLYSVRQLSEEGAIGNWFDPDDPSVTASNIFGPVSRMGARLQWMLAERDGLFEVLTDTIHGLAALDENYRVHVHIISSLAGNTGSGIFLQTACYVKEAIRAINPANGRVNGYFLMGLAFQSMVQMSQLEYMLAYTYASLKELNRFTVRPDIPDFEFGIGKTCSTWPVFDSCYLMDYMGGSYDYRTSMASFVYQAIVTGWGTQVAPLTRLRMQYEGLRDYAAFAVFKLVYPVDDLFAYFARHQVADHIRDVWCCIDTEFQEELTRYKTDVCEGIPHPKPDLGSFYLQALRMRCDNTGLQGWVFREIFKDAQICDEDDVVIRSKADKYIQDFCAWVRDSLATIHIPKGRAVDFPMIDDAFVRKNPYEDDETAIRTNENALKDFWSRACHSVDALKHNAAYHCFWIDHDEDNYVSKSPETDKHHLNTVILLSGEEMHPMAVRYFLYDLKNTEILPRLATLKSDNEKLRQQIEDYFNQESAVFGFGEAWEKNRKAALNWLTGRRPLLEWKRQYVTESFRQKERIELFIEDKMQEVALNQLLSCIDGLLEKIEAFFASLPRVLDSLGEERDYLLNKHNRDLTYVLFSPRLKEDIYQAVISHDAPPSFPRALSASLYRNMYHNTVTDLERSTSARSKSETEDPLKEFPATLQQFLNHQEESLRHANPAYADMDVISALREEAMRETDGRHDSAMDYMERRFRSVRERDGIRYLPLDIHRIQAWVGHPSCILPGLFSAQELDRFFSDPFPCSRLSSTLMRKNEIAWIDTAPVMRLRDFASLSRTGPYYHAYSQAHHNPHLDRRWRRQFPDIVPEQYGNNDL